MESLEGSSDSREIVPYASQSRQIVLRHKNIVVVYDEQSKQLSTAGLNSLGLESCPLCQRPFPAGSTHPTDEDPGDEASFVSPHYFRRLAASRTQDQQYPARSLPIDPQNSAEQRHNISASAFSEGYFHQFFTDEGVLGRGGRGVVILARHWIEGNNLGLFALKRVPCSDDHDWLKRTLAEVSLLQDLSHQNLVPYRHVWLEHFQPSSFQPRSPHLFILQQYCNSGTLLQYVLGSRLSSESVQHQQRSRKLSRTTTKPDVTLPKRLPLDEIYTFFKGITAGLAHLHSNGYVHRDLKPQNCLLHRAAGTLRVLVSDFGEMQKADAPRNSSTGYTGTISFAAPEVLRRDEQGNFGAFTAKSDVFSLGMIVYFMCFGRLPYQSADLWNESEDLTQLRHEVVDWKGLREERKERPDLPDQLYNYLQLLLSYDPEQRPGTEEILGIIRGGAAFTEPPKSSSPVDEFGYRSFPDGTSKQQTTADGTSVRWRSSKSSTLAFQEKERRPSDQKSSPSPEGSLALKKKREDQRSSAMLADDNQDVPLLMAPPRRHLGASIWAVINHPRTIALLKLTVFMLKYRSLTAACDPLAPRPEAVYSLISLAAVDLIGLSDRHLASTSLALAILHLAMLFVGTSARKLCQPVGSAYD
ncbi:MAG: putative serine/threonine-protein kinase iks1 [Alyxoria varia]|nr:MAG: putative serine/threonine-protein kinase iks1 [Alyxoria varia]